MALISISDLEQATGEIIDDADIPRFQWYIDAVSSYIEDLTGQQFEEVIDCTLVCQSDSYGIIEFPSLNSVTTVEYRDPWLGTYTEVLLGNYAFDGIGSVFNLCAYSTYRLKVSYGSSEVPESIEKIATQLVLAGTGLDPSAAAGLKTLKVGDVEEQYGVITDGSGRPIVTLTSLQSGALQAWSVSGSATWRL